MERDTSDLFNKTEVDDVKGDIYVEWSDDYIKACEFLFGTDDILQDFEEDFCRLSSTDEDRRWLENRF